jgi:hypothetical protein
MLSASLQKLDRAMENQQFTAIEFLAHVTAREAAVGRYQARKRRSKGLRQPHGVLIKSSIC